MIRVELLVPFAGLARVQWRPAWIDLKSFPELNECYESIIIIIIKSLTELFRCNSDSLSFNSVSL